MTVAARTSVLAGILAFPLSFVACGGGAATPQPSTPNAPPPKPAASSSAAPAPIPIAQPEVSPAPASCDAFVKANVGKAKDPVCSDAKSVTAALANAALAEQKGDAAARDSALASVATCDKLPALLVDALRAELAPIECAEAIVAPALDAHGKEALPQHLAAARALVGASRLARLRPKKGAFDLLARAEVDPAAGEAGTKLVIAWKEAIEGAETEALLLSKGAPAELAAIARFEAAAAWLAFAKELRGTPLPDEIKKLKKNDPDLETHYFAKLDEVTMPIVDRARQLALAGLGVAVRDGILVKTLPSYAAILDPFRSRPGFEVRATRDLDLMTTDALGAKDATDATKMAAVLPAWAVYGALERVMPASLLDPAVLMAMAEGRGIPSALRREAEHEPSPNAKAAPKLGPKEQKTRDAQRAAVVLSRVRVALAYGSRPDAEAASTFTSKDPADQLRVSVAKALLGPSANAPPPKPGDPAATASTPGYDLAQLDAIAKKGGPTANAAAYDAALLSLDAAELFGAPEGTMPGAADPKKSYEDAIARLDAVAARKGIDPARADRAKKLADGARESVKLLGKPVKK